MSETNDTEDSKVINCSFCQKGRHQVDEMIEGPSFNGEHIYICNECVTMSHSILTKDNTALTAVKKKKEKFLTPEQIKVKLDEFVIGQDPAKVAISVAIYNHFKRINNTSKTEIEKSNLMMIGESGCGKTLTVKTVAKLLDIPIVIADATTLTESGYVGEDVDNLVKKLLASADDDIERAQKGIIFIDEIDKKSKKGESATVTRDVSGEGVQQSLLKLIEGTVIKVDDYEDTYEFNTKDVLFIFSGAFVGLDEVIRKSRAKTSIGIGATLTVKQPFSDVVKSVTPDDFVKYGIIPEFIGRCPIHVVFDDLTPSMMVRILREPKNSIVGQFKALFKYDGIDLEFDDKYLQNVADECLRQKVGARGLRTIMERDLQSTQFVLPRLAKDGVDKIFIDASGVAKYVYKAKKRANNG